MNILLNMHYFPAATAMVGVSELRTRLKKILELAAKITVFLGKRQKPVAVLLPIAKYQEMENLLDLVEDAVLGYIAQERDKATDQAGYIGLEEAEVRVELRKKKK